MEMLAELPITHFANQTEWRDWLAGHHTEPKGVWLKIAKKTSGAGSVSYAEALDEALCYGWIDGQKQTYDEQFYLQKFTPRRPGSMWSKVNVEKVKLLEAAGKLQPAGVAEIEAAKKDGRWGRAYDSVSASTVPDDFQAALEAHPRAKAFYATLNKANTYSITWRIQTAKTPETRQAKIEKFITMLENGETLH